MSLWLGILNVIDRKVDVIDGLHDVPDIDSVDNAFIRDVLGNKRDTHDGDSVVAFLHTLNEHTHSVSMIYPELANSVQLTSEAGVWAAYGTPIEIIPAGTIGEDFDIHWVILDSISANGQYTMEIFKGAPASEIVIAHIGSARNAVQSLEGSIPTLTPMVPANTRISMALSSNNAGANTLNVKLMYHTY